MMKLKLPVSDTGGRSLRSTRKKYLILIFTSKKKSMGLAVVHGIVKKMNGGISVYSCTGFSEKFPFETAVKMGVKDLLHKPVQINHLLKKIRILLDNPSSPTVANP